MGGWVNEVREACECGEVGSERRFLWSKWTLLPSNDASSSFELWNDRGDVITLYGGGIRKIRVEETDLPTIADLCRSMVQFVVIR